VQKSFDTLAAGRETPQEDFIGRILTASIRETYW